MKIEFIEEETPSVWQMATSGRLEASALVIRNLRKLSLDESSSAGKAAKSALNVYNHIERRQDELDGSFATLSLDACGLVYVMIHQQAGLLNKALKGSRNDQFAKDVESIMIDVETVVLKTILKIDVSSKNGAIIADYRRKMEECLERYSEGKKTSGTAVREAVVEVVAKKLMNYEDMEMGKGKSAAIQPEAGRRKIEDSDTSSLGTGSWDDSSEHEQSEGNQESGVEIGASVGRQADSRKKLVGNKGESLENAGTGVKRKATDRIDKQRNETSSRIQDWNKNVADRSIETKNVKGPGNYNRKNRATTLSDRHRMPDDFNDKKFFQPGPHRRSTTPVPPHNFNASQSSQVTASDASSFGQKLANDITARVMSTIQDSVRM